MKLLSALTLLALFDSASAEVKFPAGNLKGSKWNQKFAIDKFEEQITLDMDVQTTTISGFSSGAFLTSTLLNIKPELFDGAGILSGAAPGTYGKVKHTKNQYKGKKVFVYHGTKDAIVPFKYGSQGADYWQSLGADIKRDFVADFNHIIPNALPEQKPYNPQKSCALLPKLTTIEKNLNPRNDGAGVHYNCGYNLARNMLTHISKDKLNEMDIKIQSKGEFYKFNQKQFNANGAAKMYEAGYIYIPKGCEKKGAKCKLHFHFHGCMSSAKTFNDVLVRKSGLLEFAASNNMVVVFPQNDDFIIIKTKDGKDFKFQYCWSGAHQNDPNHPQLKALIKMIEAFKGGKK